MAVELNADRQASLEGAIERLTARFSGVFSKETVAFVLDTAWRQLAGGAIVRQHLPNLVERFARDQLRAAAQADGLIAKELPEILFVCVRNAGRSQMAAAFAQHLAGDHVAVRSAGSEPGEVIQPEVIEAMSEIGLDITQEFPKPLTDVVVRAADVVITMGCGDACPVYPGKRYEDWPVADPSGQPIEAVRLIRRDIYNHVRALLREIVPTGALADLRRPDGSEL